MLLILLSGAWILGIFIGSLFRLPFLLIFTGVIPLFTLFFKHRYRQLVIIVSLSLFALFGGAIRDSYSQPTGENQLRLYTGQIVEIKGMIDRDPEIRDKTVHLELSAAEINLDGQRTTVKGRVLLYASRNTSYDYGDIIRVTGKLETPPQLDDFDYQGYLENQGIYSVMSYPRIEVIEQGKGSKPLSWIYSLRNHLADMLENILPEPQAALAQGIVLGMRGNIPQTLKDDFSHTGTSHILAISGQNLSILAGILVSIGVWLFGRRHYIYIWLALAIIWLYTILTGLSPPVIRAAIMASLFLTAELLGRQRSAVTALAFAAAVMIGISPFVLRDASFQLSFLAMTGLVFIAPPLQNLSRKAVSDTIGESGFPASLTNIVLDSLAVSLAAIIAVWPVIAYYFKIISLVAPLTTLLALPALTGIIIISAIAAALGIVFLPLGQIIGWVAWLFLSYFLLIVRGFATLSISYIQFSSVNVTFLLFYYILLALILWIGSHRQKVTTVISRGFENTAFFISGLNIKLVIAPLLVIAILVSITIATLHDTKLHVSFLDVGQGDAILIQQGSQQVLVDGGPSPQAISLELGKRMPFWDRTIELVILTHPDADHLTGLVEVLKRYRVEEIVYPDFPSDQPLYTEWQQLIKDKKISVTLAQTGQQISLGNGVQLDVLNPTVPASFEAGSDDNGVVARLSMGKTSFLLTADISWQAEFALIAHRADINCTMLKVAHHGSASSTTAEFLAVVKPQIAVISAGKDNKYGHPAPETSNRLDDVIGGNNIYRTDEVGTIEFITDGERLWVKTE